MSTNNGCEYTWNENLGLQFINKVELIEGGNISQVFIKFKRCLNPWKFKMEQNLNDNDIRSN